MPRPDSADEWWVVTTGCILITQTNHFSFTVGKFISDKITFTYHCWKFRCLGRNVQYNRLHISSFPEKGRSMELDYQWSSHRRNLSGQKRCARNGGKRCHWRRSISFNWRRWHLVHTAISRSIQKSIATNRRSSSSGESFTE